MDKTKTEVPARARILVVDDDAGNLAALGRLLQRHYEVLAAPSGERALQIAADTPLPDLILLDVMMPGMTGYEVLTKLEPLLKASSVQANQLIEPRAALLKAAFGPLGAELVQQVEHFLYPEALETVKRARREHKGLAG